MMGELRAAIWETAAPACPSRPPTYLPIPPGTEKRRAEKKGPPSEDGEDVMEQAKEHSEEPLSDSKAPPATLPQAWGSTHKTSRSFRTGTTRSSF